MKITINKKQWLAAGVNAGWIKKGQAAEAYDEEWEATKQRIKNLKMEKEKENRELSDIEWEEYLKNADLEIDREDEEIQRRVYENTKNIKYWVTEYKVTHIAEDDKMEIIRSTEVTGLENADKMCDALEELHLDRDDVLVYVEDFDDKGILAT